MTKQSSTKRKGKPVDVGALYAQAVNARDRDAAVSIIKNGIATPADVARLAGTSRQLVLHWITRAGVDWRKARDARLAKEWKALGR